MDLEDEIVVMSGERPGEGGVRYGYEMIGDRMTPKEYAGFTLYKTLKKYPEITDGRARNLQNEYINFPDIEMLHMETFAAALVYSKDMKDQTEVTVESFKDKNMKPYLERLIPINKKYTSKEMKKIRADIKGQILKYVIGIFNYRELRNDLN